jgi:hypothetical protein
MKRLALYATLLLAGCGGGLPAPPRGEHPLAAYVEVPYPPPAALAETVPNKPNGDAVWVDGEWNFHGEGYVWRRGGWVAAPQGSKYAPWQAWYRKDGRLMFARGTWYDAQQQRLRPPKPLTPAETPPNQVTSEFQTGR